MIERALCVDQQYRNFFLLPSAGSFEERLGPYGHSSRVGLDATFPGKPAGVALSTSKPALVGDIIAAYR